jgi:hypothetical protein
LGKLWQAWAREMRKQIQKMKEKTLNSHNSGNMSATANLRAPVESGKLVVVAQLVYISKISRN